MPDIPLPDFLRKEKSDELNLHLLQKTGCFAFFTTDQPLLATQPGSWQDAFSLFTVALYTVYHDHGCKFLSSLLEDALCPFDLPFPGNCRKHTWATERLRSAIAHCQAEENRIRMQNMLYYYYSREDETIAVSPTKWPDFINALTEAHWQRMTERLTKDSNALYRYLWDWAESWEKQPDRIPGLKALFVRSLEGSIDARICKPFLLDNGISGRDVGQYTAGNAAPIQHWREVLSSEFLSGQIKTPEEIRQRLGELIKESVTPREETSSAIAQRHGFGIPGI